ncbi:MAG TPA: phage Gp37/Gp68 family protein [Armatimonadota bacterium]
MGARKTDGVGRIDATWNPITGCTKVSPGCKHCYAETLALRLQGIGAPKYKNGFALTLQSEHLDLPRTWKRPRFVFVNSMSDVFHEGVPEEYVHAIFRVMRETPRHLYMMLTKRSERLLELAPRLDWAENVWMGVTVENADYTFRIDHLREVPARLRFLSLEPLLGPLPGLNLSGIEWVLVGGESGRGARPLRAEWVTLARDQCAAAGVPFTFHHWGGENSRLTGRTLEGRIYDEVPARYHRTAQLSLF